MTGLAAAQAPEITALSVLFLWRCGSGANRRIRVLQTLALPLGYRTVTRSLQPRLLARRQFHRSRRDHREPRVRIPSFFMVHGLCRSPQFFAIRVCRQPACVRVAIEARKVTAGNLQPDPMACEKY